MSAQSQPGIYVEIVIDAPMERVWELTQIPALHQRWDLRFSSITYLPKATDDEPQRFLYETRIGAGLAIRGTGESVATRIADDGSATSSLKFASDDALSLIREGAGYWRYIPLGTQTRFFTWYDYEVRFGAAGRFCNLVFKPAMGWATAWSFDRLRIWAEQGIPPEESLRLSAVHAVSRSAIAFVWLWHGLIPKLIYRDADEQTMLAQAGVASHWLPWIGGAEVAMALLVLTLWNWRGMFVVQLVLMIAALTAVAVQSPAYVSHAFNPVTLNLSVVALSAIGWMVSASLPSAHRCLRVDPKRKI